MATKNNKTLGVMVRFFTNDYEVTFKGKPQLIARASGTLLLEANSEKGIKHDWELFAGLEDIQPAMRALLKRNKITVVDDMTNAKKHK